MRNLATAMVCVGVAAFAQAPVVRVSTQASGMEPRVARPGTVITVTGTSLDKNRVEEVYLTDHRFDWKVKVLEQSDGKMLIRVPPMVKPGRLQLLVLTAGENGQFLEMPLYLVIEAEDQVAVAPPVAIKGEIAVASNGNNPEKRDQ